MVELVQRRAGSSGGGGGGGVTSVNGDAGPAVSLNAGDIAPVANRNYVTDAELASIGDIAANTAARHTHANLAVLDGTEQSFTTALQTDLNANTAARHTHANQAVLDGTEESFTTALQTDLNANTAARHAHANQAVLDAITAPFTTTDEAKLDNISVWQGPVLNPTLVADHGYATQTLFDAAAKAAGNRIYNFNTDRDNLLDAYVQDGGNVTRGMRAIKPVATRTHMAALPGALAPYIYLSEAGREGNFTWNAGDLSAEVTSDPQQGWYIPPATDATGASGAYVRDDREYAVITNFGAVHNGTASTNTTAIQAAVNISKYVQVPWGVYPHDGTITIPIESRAGTFAGPSGNLTGKAAFPFQGGAALKFEIADTDPETPQVLCRANQFSFSGVSFLGDEGNPNDVGIRFEKNDGNNDDMDGYVQDCDFLNHAINILFYGRAITASNNNLSNGRGIVLRWPTTGVAGGDISTSDLYKGRGHRIVNNRFHGHNRCITIQDHIARGIVITGNNSDLGDTFLLVEEGPGALTTGTHKAVIDGNTCDLSASSLVEYFGNTVLQNTTISNNSLGGAIAGTITGTGDSRPPAGIRLNSCAEIDGLNVIGNEITATDQFGVVFTNDSGGADITPNNINIIGNIFSDIGLDGTAGRAVFESVYTNVTNFNFSKNMLKNPGGTLTNILDFTSGTVTNIVAFGNVYPDTITFLNGTAAGNRDLFERQGGIRVASDGQTVIGDNGAYSGSVPLCLDRGSSATGGVGFEMRNGSGNVRFFGQATGAGVGHFFPSTDGQVNLGTGGNRLDTVFAQNGVSASDERLKKEIKNPDEALLDAWDKVQWSSWKWREDTPFGKDDRTQHGLVAQRVASVFEDHGLDPLAHNILQHDQWEKLVDDDGTVIREAGDEWSVNYDQAEALEAAYQRRENQRQRDLIADLTARLEALESA